MEFVDFRDAVHDLIEQAIQMRETGYRLPKFSPSTEISLRTGSRDTGYPDIVIENEELYLLIECKINNVSLQPKQEKAYEDYFKENAGTKKRAFLFLVPDNYQGGDTKAIITKAKGREIAGGVLHWSDLITVFEQPKLLPSTNPAYAGFYEKLCSRFRPVQFYKEEIEVLYKKKTGKAVNKLFTLIAELHEAINTDDSLSSWQKSKIDGKPDNEYGFYLRRNRPKREVWVGMWMHYWQELAGEEAYPFCISINTEIAKQVVVKLEKVNGLKRIKDPDVDDVNIAWAFEGEILFSLKNSVEAVLEIVREVLKIIDSNSKK
jgi:hypothetical protein